MPQLGNVSEKVWKRKGRKHFLRYESVYFLKVEEQRVNWAMFLKKLRLGSEEKLKRSGAAL